MYKSKKFISLHTLFGALVYGEMLLGFKLLSSTCGCGTPAKTLHLEFSNSSIRKQFKP